MTAESEYTFDPNFEPSVLASPWQRLWARVFDTYLWSLPLSVALPFAFPNFVRNEVFDGAGANLLGIFILPFALLVDAVVRAVFGNTPGAIFLGIRVERINHERLEFGLLFKRNLQIWAGGYGLGLPIVSLAAMANNYSKLKKGHQTSWDADLETRVFNLNGSPLKTVVCGIIAVVLTIATNGISRYVEEIRERESFTTAASPGSENYDPARDPVADDLARGAAQVKPQLLDAITRLDRASAEGRTLTYHYSILRRDGTDDALAKFFRTTIMPKTCSNAGTVKLMQDYQVTYRFEYSFPNADQPVVFQVTWADCAR